ncbi:MAG: PAS domain-containing protein, partial [Magnetococcales bacterium]|nr:PAS domain-containing protein [Magnetococcales bacterium]
MNTTCKPPLKNHARFHPFRLTVVAAPWCNHPPIGVPTSLSSHESKDEHKLLPFKLETSDQAFPPNSPTLFSHETPADFDPVGYLTLSHAGVIIEANTTAAKILGNKRNKLLKRPFVHLVAVSDHELWHSFILAARREGAISCDLTIHGKKTTDKSTVCHVQCIRRRVGRQDR